MRKTVPQSASPDAVAPPLVVWEQTGRWAALLRSLLTRSAPAAATGAPPRAEPRWLGRGDTPPIAEVRVESQCHGALIAGAAVVCVEWLPSHARAICELLWNPPVRPCPPLLVVGSREARAWEPLLRELGAEHCAWSPRELPAAVPLIRQCLARAAPRRRFSLRQIWDELPWPEAASPSPGAAQSPPPE